jgi:hypothetical protein
LISNRYQDRLEMQSPGIGRKPATGIPVRDPNRELVVLLLSIFASRLMLVAAI